MDIFMLNTTLINRLVEKLSHTIPPELATCQADLSHNIQAILQSLLSKLDLVSREEFEAQKAVLYRTQKKLAELEAQILHLKQLFKNPSEKDTLYTSAEENKVQDVDE
jgi:ubiquinone biosynthesis accessory factor UbiK